MGALTSLLLAAVGGGAAGAAGPATAEIDSEATERILARCDRLRARGGYETALNCFVRAQERAGRPEPRALLGQAQSLAGLGRREEALDLSRRLVTLDLSPRLAAQAHELRGRLAYELATGDTDGRVVDALLRALANAAEAPLAEDELLAEAALALEIALEDAVERKRRRLASLLVEVLGLLGREQEADAVSRRYRLRTPEAATTDGSAVAGRPVHAGGDITAPRRVYYPSPQYTEDARKARITGVVVLEVHIDEEGEVVDGRVLQGLPLGLSAAALETVRAWRFEPARRNGLPVPVLYNVTMNFQLQ